MSTASETGPSRGKKSAMFAARSATRAPWAATLVIATVASSTPAYASLPHHSAANWMVTVATEPGDVDIERLYIEAEQRTDAGDFEGAEKSWARLLDELPESTDNQAVRETIMYKLIDAHVRAYKKSDNDIVHLRTGKAAIDKYYSDFRAVHGDNASPSDLVEDKANELKRELDRAIEQQQSEAITATGTSGTVTPTQPTTGTTPSDTSKPINPKAGLGLIIGGSVAAGVGIAALGATVGVGASGVNQALDDHADAQQRLADDMNDMEAQADLDKANDDGNRYETLAIAGGVVSGAVIIGGAVMILLGVRARNRGKGKTSARINTFAPMLRHDHVGLAVGGRF